MCIIAGGALTVLTYVSGHVVFSDYLELQRMPLVGEITVFCGAMVGASIGFLWYNAHPAEIFMGDVGSLALGGAIGMLAVIIPGAAAAILLAASSCWKGFPSSYKWAVTNCGRTDPPGWLRFCIITLS